MPLSTLEFEQDRAKRLYAAVMSSRNGTSLATEYKRVKKNPGELAQFWYWLSEEIEMLVNEKLGEMLKQPEKRVVQ